MATGADLRSEFDFWKVAAISSLAVALINLGLLYFLALSIRTLVLSEATVIGRHPDFILVEPAGTPSASPSVAPAE